MWEDPDFDPAERAVYYVRVIEIPRPRWTAYDAVFFNLDLPDEVPMVIQDRAYSSPIWFDPAPNERHRCRRARTPEHALAPDQGADHCSRSAAFL